MKTLLWLDDMRNPNEGNWVAKYSPIKIDINVVWVKSYDEFTNWINANGLPDAICFDHDLGHLTLNGNDCARFVVYYCLDRNINIPLYNVQSSNPPGRENICGILESYRKFYLTENNLPMKN